MIRKVFSLALLMGVVAMALACGGSQGSGGGGEQSPEEERPAAAV